MVGQEKMNLNSCQLSCAWLQAPPSLARIQPALKPEWQALEAQHSMTYTIMYLNTSGIMIVKARNAAVRELPNWLHVSIGRVLQAVLAAVILVYYTQHCLLDRPGPSTTA